MRPGWRNCTSYSRSDKVHEIRSTDRQAGPIKLLVTRRAHLDGWWVYCEPFSCFARECEASDLEAAQQEAEEWLKSALELAIESLTANQEATNGHQ
jgi:predicted RNase H-like HicB family nuclease